MHPWVIFVVAVGIIVFAAVLIGAPNLETGGQLTIAFIVIAAVTLAIAALLIYAAVRAQYKKVKTGKEALIGAFGVATTDLNPKGEVRVNGEFWEATAQTPPINNGESIQVADMQGMFLIVKKQTEPTSK